MKKYKGMLVSYFDLGNREKAAQIANELRSSPSSISSSLMIGSHSAFIVYCDELLYELRAIRNLNLDICTRAKSLPSVALQQLFSQAIIEEIHQNNEVENVHSTRKEIKDQIKVIENGKRGKRFDGMIRKYQLLLTRDKIPLVSCQDIRNLYDSFILEEVLAENPKDAPDGLYFRKDPVAVSRHNETIHEGVFPESALNESMELALSLLNNDEYDPLIRIAAFHYLFGYIHPFYNGNGRMTRFISSYFLSTEKIHLLVALRLSYVIKSHRPQYYSMFKTTNDARNYGDMTRFVIDFLRLIREACEQVLSFLREKIRLIDYYYDIIHQLQLDDTTRKLLFILAQVSVCESDSLTTKELMKIMELSPYLLTKHLTEIKSLIIVTQTGNANSYRANLQKLDSIG